MKTSPRSAFRRRRSTGLTVRALDTGEAEVLIYDEISPMFGVSARDLVQELRGITAKTIHLRINCPGGDVFDGHAIYNALRQHPAHVITHIDGVAASIASIVALAGDEVEIAENAFMMIHQPWALTAGNASDHRRRADTLDKIGDALIAVYADRSAEDRAQVVGWMEAETWFSAQEALDAGFVDVITSNAPVVSAAFDLSVYNHVPDALREQLAKVMQDMEDALREAGLTRRDAKIAARVWREQSDQREAGAPPRKAVAQADKEGIAQFIGTI